jgi:predicted nucleotidyltransferase
VNFYTVTQKLLEGFLEKRVRYALIGGFALGALGIPRATMDIDFLVHYHDLPKIKGLMEGLGYSCVFQTENVSQYVSPLELLGEVDFLHALRKASLGMLERAIEKEILGGKLKIKVLRAEDIIGLKVQSAANNESRFNREYADIEALMAHYRADLDWELVEEYFSIFDQRPLFTELKRRYLEAE